MFSIPNFILFSSVLALCTGEMLKLENKTHILCVTDDDGDSAIYVYPPVVEAARNNSILIENEGFWNDWVLKNSKEVIVPMVKDKRWENFETRYTDMIYFPSLVNLGFSTTCDFPNIYFDHPVLSIEKQKRSIERARGWAHYSEYTVLNSSDFNNFFNFKINVTDSKDVYWYWKVHDYNLRWAESSSETETVVPISSHDVPCIVLYTYLCPYCILNIRVDGSNFNVQGSDVKEWTSHRISVNSASNLTISRSTEGNITVGQWAIDIRPCPCTKSNKTIYEVSLKNDAECEANRTCHFVTLTGRKQEQNPDADIFNCTRGLLGRACDISCKELLSSDLMYCQEHQICDNTSSEPKCFCAWGSQGSACNETCAPGSVGLSCKREEKCDNC